MSKKNSKISKRKSISKDNYLPKKLIGGFIRAPTTPLFPYGDNPIYAYQTKDILCNTGDVKFGGGNKKSRRLSRKSNIYYRYI